MRTGKHTQNCGNTAMDSRHTLSRPSFLYLVSQAEVDALRKALLTGQLPADFESKLRRLAGGSLLHQFIAQNCRLFVLLLVAAHAELFRDLAPQDCDRLLRVLVYVRKDDDAVPDYRPDGFVDDLQEVRAVVTELNVLLQKFKAWRLRRHVPTMWLN